MHDKFRSNLNLRIVDTYYHSSSQSPNIPGIISLGDVFSYQPPNLPLLLLEIHKHLRPFFPTWTAHIFCVMVPLNSSSSQDYGLTTIISCLGIFLFVMSEIVQHNEMFEIHIKFIHIYIYISLSLLILFLFVIS